VINKYDDDGDDDIQGKDSGIMKDEVGLGLCGPHTWWPTTEFKLKYDFYCE
jgi:hypothetical protein